MCIHSRVARARLLALARLCESYRAPHMAFIALTGVHKMDTYPSHRPCCATGATASLIQFRHIRPRHNPTPPARLTLCRNSNDGDAEGLAQISPGRLEGPRYWNLRRRDAIKLMVTRKVYTGVRIETGRVRETTLSRLKSLAARDIRRAERERERGGSFAGFLRAGRTCGRGDRRW